MTTSATPGDSRRVALRRPPSGEITAGRRRRAGGFTLTELMLVLVIVSLVAALVVPRLGPVGRRIGVRTASYDLLWLLRQARWWSMSTGRTCLVNLQPVAGGYSADVAYLAGPDGPPQPLREEWTHLEQLPAARKLMQIPPDMGVSRRKELTVRFTPWGVREDYVIELAETAGRAGMRIEIRRPSGLIWLLPAERPGAFDRSSLAAVEHYWEEHWRRASR